MKRPCWDYIVASQDFHPAGHCSFASTHGVDPFTVPEGYGDMVWPDHCVIGTPGAELHPDLDQSLINVIIRKGLDMNVDSYSAFADNKGQNSTALVDMVDGSEYYVNLYVCGIATDVCVKHTVLDAQKIAKIDYDDIVVIKDACAGVTSDGHMVAIGELVDNDILCIDSTSETLDMHLADGDG